MKNLYLGKNPIVFGLLAAASGTLLSCGNERGTSAVFKEGLRDSAAEHVGHENELGCFKNEDIGELKEVQRPQGMPRDFLSLAEFGEATAAQSFFCPASFTYDEELRFCVKDGKALGPFPSRLVELCKKNSGGSACEAAQLNAKYASSLRGSGNCPVGTDLRPSGFCSDGSNVYGPFTKDQVKVCKKANGGQACESQRWSLAFAESLGVPGQFPMPLKDLKIAIDSGHGGNPSGWEPGAVSPFYSEVTDYQLNIETTTEIKKFLEQKGAKVSLFQYPTSFQGPDLEGRGERAAGHNIFVSIHYNRYNSVVQGSEVFTHVSLGSANDAKLAYSIQDRLVSRVWNGGDLFDRGVKSANFGVLRGAAPIVEAAVLVEGFFLDHNEGVVKIESRRKLSAQAIAEGIANYWMSR